MSDNQVLCPDFLGISTQNQYQHKKNKPFHKLLLLSILLALTDGLYAEFPFSQ
jgi:hypothetical protein